MTHKSRDITDMSTFANYARYYDLLYQDKDYARESKFIDQLLQTHAPATQSILELGCGTGIHATLLAKKGYALVGIDLSNEMLEQANQRLQHLPPEQACRLQFLPGDIRTVRVAQSFDAVISLFHVISYQTTNADLQAAFTTVKAHLKPGGIFIFDCWYGPAVLSDRPTVRIKRLEDEVIQVTRIAEPVMYANENWVDVNYQVFIKDRASDQIDQLQETHRMRYLFKPEVEWLLQEQNMILLRYGEWMTSKEPGFQTWGVYFVVQG